MSLNIKWLSWIYLIILLPSKVLTIFKTSSCSACQTFSPCSAAAAAEEPFWGPDAFNSWWCQAQGGRRTRRREDGGARGRLSTEPWKHGTRSMTDDRHAAKWQNNARRKNSLSARAAPPWSTDELKSHLNCGYKRPIFQANACRENSPGPMCCMF